MLATLQMALLFLSLTFLLVDFHLLNSSAIFYNLQTLFLVITSPSYIL